MMNESENIDRQGQDFQEECLQYECEQALLRGHFQEPSPEAEWTRFHTRLNTKKQEIAPRRIGRWVAVGIAMAAAVVLAVVLPWNWTEEEKEDIRVLFTATEEAFPLIIEEQSGKSGPVRTTLIAQDKNEKVKQGIVYTAKKADYTRQVGNYPRKSIVAIPCGQVYKLILNDSTEVWLNADSRLTFPTRFTGNKRGVKLEGEAYFKVAHDENRPFVIETEKLTVSVLGTEFNMKAYKNSEAHVTLVEGAVKIAMPEAGKEVVLMPGQDMTYINSDFSVKKVDTDYYTQWRNGYFYFDDMYLVDILSDLGRWYKMTVEIEQDSLLMNQRLHFVAERSESFEQVIEQLSAFEYLSIAPEDGKLMVRRKK